VSGTSRGLAVGAVLGAVMLASAQQIIGGHALDANQRVGSEGINTRVGRSNAPGLSQNLYNPALRSSAANRVSAGGIQQPTYWTTTARGSGGWGQNGGASYATSAGLVYDPLAAPLYRPLSPPVQVQTGRGTLDFSAGQQQPIASPLYRPLR